MRSIQGNGLGNKYKVKYDAVAVLAYGELMHDGVNNEGLQVNTLFYGAMSMDPIDSADSISQFTLGEYILTNFATVDEMVKALPSLKYGSLTLEGMPMEITLHWSITDKSGDRVIIELDEDGVKVYRGEGAAVMTNDPYIAEHLKSIDKVKDSWVESDRDTDYGSNGNSNAPSRHIHASYFLSKLGQPSSIQNAMMKVSTVPFRIPADTPHNLEKPEGMTGYSTEWTLTQSLESGDSVWEYNFGNNWNTLRFNVYELMGTNFRMPLATSSFEKLENNLVKKIR